MRSPLTFFVALALLGGCFSLPPGTPPDLSSPYNTLSHLVNSYVNLDDGGVDLILDDDFIFYFDEDDVGRDPGNGYRIPLEGWGRYSELIATRNMFAEAERIEFDEFKLEDMEPLPEGATFYTSGWIEYRFRHYYNEEDDKYIVSGHARFELEKRGDDWLITRWADLRQTDTEFSWGWLKALYRL
jgi:hypothetical protein